MDPLTIATIGLTAGSSIAGTVGNLFGASAEKEAAERNYNLGKQNLDWQKEMQAESWRRDDTAVQRRARDLEAAGINPLMAAGSAAGNSPVVHTEAPQMDVRAAGAQGRAVGKSALDTMSMMGMAKDFAVKDAQAQMLQAQASSAQADADYKKAITPGAADLQSSQIALNNMTTQINHANNMFKLSELQAFKRDANFVIETGLKLLKTDDLKHEFQMNYERQRTEAVNELVKAGIDREVAEAIGAQFAASLAKNQLDVNTASMPAHIAGAYADVAGKVVGAGANAMNLAGYLQSFLKQYGK